MTPVKVDKLCNDYLLTLAFEELEILRERLSGLVLPEEFQDLAYAFIYYTVHFIAAAIQSSDKDDRS